MLDGHSTPCVPAMVGGAYAAVLLLPGGCSEQRPELVNVHAQVDGDDLPEQPARNVPALMDRHGRLSAVRVLETTV